MTVNVLVEWTAKVATGLDHSCSCMPVGGSKKLVAESIATSLSANQSSGKVGLVNTFKTHLKTIKI